LQSAVTELDQVLHNPNSRNYQNWYTREILVIEIVMNHHIIEHASKNNYQKNGNQMNTKEGSSYTVTYNYLNFKILLLR
jgi:hypothetical protein